MKIIFAILLVWQATYVTSSLDHKGLEDGCICCDANLKLVKAPGYCNNFGFSEPTDGYPFQICLPAVFDFPCTEDIHCPANYVCNITAGQCIDALLTGPKPQDCNEVYNSCVSRCPPVPSCFDDCALRRLECQCDLVRINCINRFCQGLSGTDLISCLNTCSMAEFACLSP